MQLAKSSAVFKSIKVSTNVSTLSFCSARKSVVSSGRIETCTSSTLIVFLV